MTGTARDENGPWPEDGPGPTGGAHCGAHAGLGADLRGSALHLLERVRAAVEPLADGDGEAPAPGSAGACRACPVCAVIAVLRGERSELASRLAEHATGLVAVLTAVLEADAARAAGETDAPADTGRADTGRADPGRAETGHRVPPRRPGPPRPSGRPVQRIVVYRR